MCCRRTSSRSLAFCASVIGFSCKEEALAGTGDMSGEAVATPAPGLAARTVYNVRVDLQHSCKHNAPKHHDLPRSGGRANPCQHPVLFESPHKLDGNVSGLVGGKSSLPRRTLVGSRDSEPTRAGHTSSFRHRSGNGVCCSFAVRGRSVVLRFFASPMVG
jgi:hypothetical protein